MARSFRQKILHLAYPLIMLPGRLRKNSILFNTHHVLPHAGFYNLAADLNNGTALEFSSLKGKKVMIVNTASDCGYTRQYGELQQLYENNKATLAIIAFPSNDFKEQEQGTDHDIAQFCQVNFGVQFPVARKTAVRKSKQQHPVFAWLSHPALNGWNNKSPQWNFSKYLVNEEGVLTHYFGPGISPLGKEVKDAMSL
jgi:glutathione peroxidase